MMFNNDLRKAYGQFKLDPADINFCVYLWNSSLYLDLALIMGARSAAFLCQKVTDSVRYIAGLHDIALLNYLDDLCAVSPPQKSWSEFRFLSELLEKLGLEESVQKSVSPSTQVEFLGILFNSDTQTMEVTQERLQEISTLVESWLKKSRATKKELQSLIGKLSFISKCVFGSWIFISRLLVSLQKSKQTESSF